MVALFVCPHVPVVERGYRAEAHRNMGVAEYLFVTPTQRLSLRATMEFIPMKIGAISYVI